MKIDFREIESGKNRYEFDVEPEEIDFENSWADFSENIVAEVEALSSGDEIIVRGKGRTAAKSDCVRCLKPVELPLEININIVIHRTDGPIEKDTGDDDFVVVSQAEGVYDLAPHLREAFLIELPAKILCRENCKGLCPSCGADLNVRTCDCSKEKGSGTWEAFRDLLG